MSQLDPLDVICLSEKCEKQSSAFMRRCGVRVVICARALCTAGATTPLSPASSQARKTSVFRRSPMRVPALFASVLVLTAAALGSNGTVDFNFIPDTLLTTAGLPGGVVVADFNRDGIPDLAYTLLCCGGGGLLVVKMGTGGGHCGPDVQYGPSES